MQRYQMHELLAMASKDVSMEVFASLGLSAMINDSLDKADAWEKKDCALRAPLIMVLVLSMSLYRVLSIFDVFKGIVSQLRSKKRRLSLEPVCQEALYHARERLGVDAARILFDKTAESIQARPSFHGMTVYAIDGSRADVADTVKNDAFFGRTKAAHGESGSPSLKTVCLVTTETREVRAAVFGPCYMSEKPAADAFVAMLDSGDIVIVDRGLPSFELFGRCNSSGAHYVARISSVWKPRKLRQIGTGDWLVEIRTRVPVEAGARRQHNQTKRWAYMTVRMVEYTFKSTGERIRLLTDLLDATTYGALELAELYHERWEIELVYDELKTHLESTAQGVARTIFRSQTPNGAIQEAYGMLAVYNLVRRLMAKSAKRAKVPPDEISFVGTLTVIKLAAHQLSFATVRARVWLTRQLLDDIGQTRVDRPRRKRQCPRVVKKRQSPYPRKRAKDQERYFDFRAELQLVDSAPQVRTS